MKRYMIKSSPERRDYLELLRELDDGFMVRIVKFHEYGTKTTEEFMARHLFDACLRTGFLTEARVAMAATA